MTEKRPGKNGGPVRRNTDLQRRSLAAIAEYNIQQAYKRGYIVVMAAVEQQEITDFAKEYDYQQAEAKN